MSFLREWIVSVSDALAKLARVETDGPFYVPGEAEIHRFPFGIWFRGHSQPEKLLEPRVFRDRLSGTAGNGRWEETNVYDHLRLRVPNYEHTYRSAFDWLCLMQHYAVPTRLLDWSESILPALYFAVKDDPEEDGEVIVLNSYRLNSLSKERWTIATPDDYHVVIRAEMATTRSFERLRMKESVVSALERAKRQQPDVTWDSFLKPIAVFPRRLNERMTLQASVFTIHGGKHYVRETQERYGSANDIIPSPASLDTINEEQPGAPILKRFFIPSECKPRIRRELFLLGVHEGTLFPEVDHQAMYLRDCWWYPAPA